MKAVALSGLVGGLLLLVALVVSFPPVAALTAHAALAWALLSACLIQGVPLLLNTLSWRALLPAAVRPRLGTLLRLRWIGAAVNALLPVAQIGGDMARARLLAVRGVRGSIAAASMIADVAVGMTTQAAFTVVGVAALALRGQVGSLAAALAVGLLMIVLSAGALLAVARLGVRRILAALPFLRRGDHLRALTARAEDIDQALDALFRRRGDLTWAFVLHLAGWFAQVAETWLVLRLLGRPVTPGVALIIESLAATARAAAFFVPGGLGVQEGALVGVAAAVGVDAPHGLALGIVKRAREVLISAPALLAWSIAERRLLGRVLGRRQHRS
jgi:putative membrane protein